MRRSRKVLAAGLAAGALGALLTPNAARAYSRWEANRRDAWIAQATAALERGDEVLPPVPWGVKLVEKGNIEKDDPGMRRLQNLIHFGSRTPEYEHERLKIAAEEQAKHVAQLSKERVQIAARQLGVVSDAVAPGTPASTLVWDNLGPAGARTEWNGSSYQGMDSGRPTAIRVDPTNPDKVYLAVSGGGLWKTTNFRSDTPTWLPMTDTLGALALGAMDLDPITPATIYIGTGDAFDEQGGSVLRSTDSGATWGAPVLLQAMHPIGSIRTASSIRQIMVDPNSSNKILATTSAGLYRSNDSGATWTMADLPKPAAYNWIPTGGTNARDLEATWDIAYLGFANGLSQFMVSGVYACPGFAPPGGGGDSATCPAGPVTPAPSGNVGDVWKSVDGGATWTSSRVQGLLPTQTASYATDADTAGLGDLGRIALGAGAASVDGNGKSLTSVYFEGASVSDGASKTIMLFSTRDGGASFKKLGTPLSTNLTNPTVGLSAAYPTGTDGDCGTLNPGHGQSWYNLAVGVDPLSSDHALVGGNLCGVRTIDGGVTWQNASHWLPSSGQGRTQDSFPNVTNLPYVHADWHTITVIPFPGTSGYMVMAGSDGGLFTSVDIFANKPTPMASWKYPDYGLINHLIYGHGTGDATMGNTNILYAGLQDNGTRWRISHTENVSQPLQDTRLFDQIIGGDGFGGAVASDPQGQNTTYWASVEFSRYYCRPGNHQCGNPTTVVNGTEIANWTGSTSQDPNGEPFVMRYSPTYDAQASVISASNTAVWKLTTNAFDVVTYTALTDATFTRTPQGQAVHASPIVRNIGGVPTHVYGVATTGGRCGIILDNGGATFPLAMATTPFGAGTQSLRGAWSIGIPADPTHLGGTDATQTYLCSSATTADTKGKPIASTTGHLFVTKDGGATWQTFHGNGTGYDLPNVPVDVVRFDPSDLSDLTIYAGTDLGLYRTTDGGLTWARYGANLPAVRVEDISVSINGSLIRVSTFGRGLWELYPKSDLANGNGNGDWDKNGVIDFFDLHALASRLGTKPKAATIPGQPGFVFGPNYQGQHYDSTVDTNGDQKLDDTDLTTLLAKFGNAP